MDVHNPIELVDLTLSFQAVARQYRKHLASSLTESGHKQDADVKLYVTKIENNCILAEIATSACEIMGSLFSVMDSVNIFKDFVITLKEQVNYFKRIGSNERVSSDKLKYTKGDCGAIADLMNTVAKNKDGQLKLGVIEYSKNHDDGASEHLRVTFTGEDAVDARRGALIASKAHDVRKDAQEKNVLMYLYQANVDSPKAEGRTGNKAVISSLFERALPVYFASEIDRERIFDTVHSTDYNPFMASYVVDVNIECDRNNKPRIYRVIHVHEIIPDDNT